MYGWPHAPVGPTVIVPRRSRAGRRERRNRPGARTREDDVMDVDRFDALTRRLTTQSPSRRRLLRGLGGSLAGAVLASVGGRSVGADPAGNSAAAAFCAA